MQTLTTIPTIYIFIFSAISLLIWSIWLAKKWVNRLDDHQSTISATTSKSSYFFPATLIFVISSMVLPFLIILQVSIFNFITKPSYQATITSYTSEWVTDRNSKGIETRTLMYDAYVSFQDQHGHVIKSIQTNVSSAQQPVIGEHIKVLYADGDNIVQELTIRNYILQFAAFFMTFIMVSILYSIFAYAMNFNMKPLQKFWHILIFRITIPLATTAMFACFIYVIFEYFFLGNPNAHPIWLAIICSVFALALLPVIIHFVRGNKNEDA